MYQNGREVLSSALKYCEMQPEYTRPACFSAVKNLNTRIAFDVGAMAYKYMLGGGREGELLSNPVVLVLFAKVVLLKMNSVSCFTVQHIIPFVRNLTLFFADLSPFCQLPHLA